MELREFIKDTLLGIHDGLHETNLAVAKKNGKTLGQDIASTFCLSPRSKDKDGYITFDVAVTASQESQEFGGGKVNVVIADLGAEAKGSNKEERVSRIKFHVQPNIFVG